MEFKLTTGVRGHGARLDVPGFHEAKQAQREIIHLITDYLPINRVAVEKNLG
jgi:hypothetical protein